MSEAYSEELAAVAMAARVAAIAAAAELHSKTRGCERTCGYERSPEVARKLKQRALATHRSRWRQNQKS